MTTSLDVARVLNFTGRISDIPLFGVSTKNSPMANTIAFISRLERSDIDIILSNDQTIFLISIDAPLDSFLNVIPSNNPRSDYGKVVSMFFEPERKVGIESTAIVSQEALIGKSCSIGHNVVIDEDVKIGDYTSIGHGTVISRGTKIGDYCTIGSNTTIGGPGFGYDMDENGNPFRIPHLGNVYIGNNVDIGSNVSIARGTIESTKIDDYVKIDDCVFIAHNVIIGRASYIIAGAEISGSVTIGEKVWISPEVTIINKVVIGDGALVGIGSTVTKDVEPGMIAVGSPAKAIKKRYE